MTQRITALASVALLALLFAGCTTTPSAAERSLKKAAQINARLGANYLRQGNLQLANEKLLKALNQDDDNVDAHATFALLQMELGKPEKARTHFETALDLSPDDPQLQNNYGTFLCNQGDYDAGIEHFLRAAENRLYSTPEYAYANAGICAHDAGRTEEARTHLRRALEIEPRLPSALRELAALEFDRGRPASARQYLERYHDAFEPTAQTLLLATRIERTLGNPDGEREFGRKLLREFPDSEQAERFLEER